MPVVPSSSYPDPGFWTKTSLIQFGYGIWVNLNMVIPGFTVGFTAVALPQITSADSKITLTLSDQSWITSILTLSSPIGCVFTGQLIDRVGRRIMLVVCHLPLLVGWVSTAQATSAQGLIIGRIITGIGLGMLVVVPRPYLSEIALPNMRGVIGTFPNLAIAFGVLIQAGLGSFLNWKVICYVNLGYSVALMIANIFLPETPYYLLMYSTIEKAEANLRKFRGRDYNIAAEMEELKDFKIENNLHKFTWKENFAALFKRSSCKPFFIMTVYLVICQFSGIYVVTMWTIEMIEHSKSSVDPHTCNIIISITRMIFSVIMSIVIFKIGRRPLALTSSVGVGISAVTLGVYILYTTDLTVIPLICYLFYMIFATFGHFSLPVLIMSELYPLQVRGILAGLSTSIMNLLIFAVNALYPYLEYHLGFSYTIIAFGVCSLLGAIFVYFYLPETKDLTLQEIEEFFNEIRPTLTSQRRIVSMMQLSRASLTKDDVSKSLIKITDKRTRKHSKENTRYEHKKDEASTSQKPPEKKKE